jgi:hypothetical protein
MSFREGEKLIGLGTPRYVPLASHSLVLRTRRKVRLELERRKAYRSLLRRTLLPAVLFTGIGILITFHPEFESSWFYKLAVLYHWLLALLIPWLVVRREKKRIRRQLL